MPRRKRIRLTPNGASTSSVSTSICSRLDSKENSLGTAHNTKDAAAHQNQSSLYSYFTAAAPPRKLPRQSRVVAPQKRKELHPSNQNKPRNSTTTTQLHLDFGQTLHRECRHCGMFYVCGNATDEREHERYCRQVQEGVVWPKNSSQCQMSVTDNVAIVKVCVCVCLCVCCPSTTNHISQYRHLLKN